MTAVHRTKGPLRNVRSKKPGNLGSTAGGGTKGTMGAVWATHTTAFLSCVYAAQDQQPPAPMNDVKIFKGWPPRDAHFILMKWYKSFLKNQRGLYKINNPTRLSNKTIKP